MTSGSTSDVNGGEPIAVGELSRQTGVSTATINYYVNFGLLPRPEKTGQTRALYTAAHAKLIEHIKALKARGLPLKVIRQVLHSDDPASELGVSRQGETPAQRPRDVGPAEPVSRERLLKESGLTGDLVSHLMRAGLLRRPRRLNGQAGMFDRHDLSAARACAYLLQAGVNLDTLGRHAEFEPIARAEAHFLAEHLALTGSVRARDDRSRAVEESFDGLRRYMRRVQVEAAYPGWLAD